MSNTKSTLLADRLYLLRAAKRIQQKTLAEALGVDAPTYSRYEKGQRALKEEQLEILAPLLDADITELKSLLIADRINVVIGDTPKHTTEMALDKIKSTLKSINNDN